VPGLAWVNRDAQSGDFQGVVTRAVALIVRIGDEQPGAIAVGTRAARRRRRAGPRRSCSLHAATDGAAPDTAGPILGPRDRVCMKMAQETPANAVPSSSALGRRRLVAEAWNPARSRGHISWRARRKSSSNPTGRDTRKSAPRARNAPPESGARCTATARRAGWGSPPVALLCPVADDPPAAAIGLITVTDEVDGGARVKLWACRNQPAMLVTRGKQSRAQRPEHIVARHRWEKNALADWFLPNG
jgi:hypothetical protein